MLVAGFILLGGRRGGPSDTGSPTQPIEPLTARGEKVLIPAHQQRDRRRSLHQPSTVETHLAKLGARNRVAVAMWAYETGRIRL